MAALLARWLDPPEPEAVFLHGLADVGLANWNGIEVGWLRAMQPVLSA